MASRLKVSSASAALILIIATLVGCDGKSSTDSDARAHPKNFTESLGQSSSNGDVAAGLNPLTNETDANRLSTEEKKNLDKLLSDLGRS